ncbi:MAG: aspartate dehydrogenase [Rhodospirillaceae bacterium]|jgi:aspartate dehydrogenase
MANKETLRVGLAGFGSIGRTVGNALNDGIPGLRLSAVAVRDQDKAKSHLNTYKHDIPLVSLNQLPGYADIIVEATSRHSFKDAVAPAIEAGKTVITATVGGLLLHDDLIQRAKETGARIIVPTGGLAGFDAMRAAAEGTIHSVQLTTRKPPHSLHDAPVLQEKGIDPKNLKEPALLFEGSARQAIGTFPVGLNIAIALSMAGVGPDKTKLAVWLDPTVSRNVHKVDVDADSAAFTMTMESEPAEDNPHSAKIAALSLLAALRSLTATMKVGT